MTTTFHHVTLKRGMRIQQIAREYRPASRAKGPRVAADLTGMDQNRGQPARIQLRQHGTDPVNKAVPHTGGKSAIDQDRLKDAHRKFHPRA